MKVEAWDSRSEAPTETPRADLEGIRMTEMKVAARQESPMVNSIRTLRALSSAEEGKESPNNTKFRRLSSIDGTEMKIPFMTGMAKQICHNPNDQWSHRWDARI